MNNLIYKDNMILYPYQYNNPRLKDIIDLIQSSDYLDSNIKRLELIEFIFYKYRDFPFHHKKKDLIFIRRIINNKIQLISLFKIDYDRLIYRINSIK